MNDPRNMAIFGSSAGAGMILAMMLRAKAEGLSLPAALGTGTPWANLTESGDTSKTNEWLDNVLVSYSGYLGRAARLYANGRPLTDPLISPIFGDFRNFPPTILTSGTRDLLLSLTVLTHRKLRQAGVEASNAAAKMRATIRNGTASSRRRTLGFLVTLAHFPIGEAGREPKSAVTGRAIRISLTGNPTYTSEGDKLVVAEIVRRLTRRPE